MDLLHPLRAPTILTVKTCSRYLYLYVLQYCTLLFSINRNTANFDQAQPQRHPCGRAFRTEDTLQCRRTSQVMNYLNIIGLLSAIFARRENRVIVTYVFQAIDVLSMVPYTPILSVFSAYSGYLNCCFRFLAFFPQSAFRACTGNLRRSDRKLS